MRVFKFGGASVKDADGVRNIASILNEFNGSRTVLIVSAMGKMTNALEKLAHSFFERDKPAVEEQLMAIRKFHEGIVEELFGDKNQALIDDLHNTFVELEWQLEDDPVGTFDFEYDQIVCIGEMLSTKIVAAYLNSKEQHCKWVDVRGLVRTDNNYRNANVDWQLSEKQIKESILEKNRGVNLFVTQGFVGGTSENFSSTLGREGSDFTAAIFANALDAEDVVIWKDVEGMLNADPKYYDHPVKLNQISYKEAVELAYFGASVIHPKTIKPLQNKNIPLWVKSFLNPLNKGSIINGDESSDQLIPSYIHKENQCLISIAPKDFSFIDEKSLAQIFEAFASAKIGINVMQNSAISFSVCLDNTGNDLSLLMESIKENYEVKFNSSLTLITIRHYNDEIIAELLIGKKVYMTQRTRSTARFVVSD